MGSTRRVTTVLYGTAWNEDNILERARRHNEDLERETGERLNFVVPWPVVASHNPQYKRHVEAERARLGPDHPIFRTQYLLETVPDAGRLFPAALLESIRGSHDCEAAPDLDVTYVAGIDVAGEIFEAGLDRPRRLLNDRDEPVVTILRLDRDPDPSDSHLPLVLTPDPPTTNHQPLPTNHQPLITNHQPLLPNHQPLPTDHYPLTTNHQPLITNHQKLPTNLQQLRIVQIRRLVGVTHSLLLDLIPELLQQWNVRRVAVDATGVGRPLASRLVEVMPTRVEAFNFTAPSKSEIGFDLRSALETGRLTLYREATPESQELLTQLRGVRYVLRGSERLEFSVPAARGHDDCVMSLALAVHAAAACPTISYYSGLIRGRDTDPCAGWEEAMWGRPPGSW